MNLLPIDILPPCGRKEIAIGLDTQFRNELVVLQKAKKGSSSAVG